MAKAKSKLSRTKKAELLLAWVSMGYKHGKLDGGLFRPITLQTLAVKLLSSEELDEAELEKCGVMIDDLHARLNEIQGRKI